MCFKNTEIDDNAGKNIPKLLVGTKSDLIDQRVVSRSTGEGQPFDIITSQQEAILMRHNHPFFLSSFLFSFFFFFLDTAQHIGATFVETSAKDGTGVATAFETLAKLMLQEKNKQDEAAMPAASKRITVEPSTGKIDLHQDLRESKRETHQKKGLFSFC